MANFLLGRLLQSLVLLLIVSIIGFAVLHLAPGGPLSLYLDNPNVRPEDIERLRRDAGISIRDLAATVMGVVGLDARLRFDPSKPDGTPRKLLDVERLSALGWRARIALPVGLRTTYAAFCNETAVAA